MSKDQLVRRLAGDVTRSDEEPSEDLRMALEQVVDQVLTGVPPERPVDWAYLICEAVQARHEV